MRCYLHLILYYFLFLFICLGQRYQERGIDSKSFQGMQFFLAPQAFLGQRCKEGGSCQLLPLASTNLLDTSEGGQNLGSSVQLFMKIFSDMYLMMDILSSFRNALQYTAPLLINCCFVLFHSARCHKSHIKSRYENINTIESQSHNHSDAK